MKFRMNFRMNCKVKSKTIRGIAFLTAFIFVSFNANANNEVSDGRLSLSSKANQALRTLDSDARIFQLSHFDQAVIDASSSSPFFSKIDLNNDDKEDLVIFGYNLAQKKAKAIAIVSDGDDYTAFLLKEYTLTKKMFSENPIYVSSSIVRDFDGIRGPVAIVYEIEKAEHNGEVMVNYLGPLNFFYSRRSQMEPLLMGFDH